MDIKSYAILFKVRSTGERKAAKVKAKNETEAAIKLLRYTLYVMRMSIEIKQLKCI